MSETVLTVDAILFDMDGTLVDSTAGVEGAWHEFSKTYPGIDVHNILSSAHGIRTVDNLSNYCGIEDPELLEKEALRFEQAIISSASDNGGSGIVLLRGVAEALKQIESRRFLPKPLWCICTSATRDYATAALTVTKVPFPDVLVAAEDVEKGKPHPDPYLLGAQKLGVDPKNCIVFEDAPSGIRSGIAAGCTTIGFLTTHSREQVESAQPTYVVEDMRKISFRVVGDKVEVVIKS